MTGPASAPHVHFGGPDLPAGRLRNLLEARVEAVPPGGAIDWVTYYFRDRRLARALLRARDRGVHVRITMEGRPRTPHANDPVLALIAGPEGLGADLRLLDLKGPSVMPGVGWKPHLHEKLFCFSGPEPVAIVGSFNPSGDEPETQPDVIAEIGDHDRGHNLLVELFEPALVEGLTAHARNVHAERWRPWPYRASLGAHRQYGAADTLVHFSPRRRRSPTMKLLAGLGRGDRLRIAASHIKGRAAVGQLLVMKDRGVELHILCDDTMRRVPAQVFAHLARSGVQIARVAAANSLPMHAKFAIAEHDGAKAALFGSWNWTTRSLWLNREIAALSENPGLLAAFEARWAELAAMAGPAGTDRHER